MNILAIDSSGPSASVAVLADGKLRFEALVNNKLTHSVTIMPLVEEALRHADITVAQLDVLALVRGPGSFTGVRIGTAMVNGLMKACGVPAVGLDALEVMAHGVQGERALVCPLRDARACQVYAAAFQDGQRVTDDVALPIADFLALIAPLAEQFYFMGDGAPVFEEKIRQTLGDRARFAPPHLNELKTSAAAHLAYLRRNQASLTPQKPLYLRQPQAVRARLGHD